MNPKEIMHRWSGYLQAILPGIHLYQVLGLAAFSYGAARARHCHLSRLSAHVPGRIQPASALRRLKRLLHNPRLDVEAVCDEMAVWLRRFNSPTARLLLLLDETPHHNQWRVVKLSVCYRRRALPLVWRTDALAGRPHRQRVLEVLLHAAAVLKRYCPHSEVVLMADRGLCWPEIIDLCQEQGWHYILRAQSHTRFVPTSGPQAGTKLCLSELVEETGHWWYGQGCAFAKAGWRQVSVVACWRSHAAGQWLLVSDLKPSLHLVRWYARRMWHEQSFRDEKSHGFSWEQSHLKTAPATHRLLLVIALAQLWLMLMGTVALSPVWKRRLGLSTHQARTRFSVCRHGWHLLMWCLNNAEPPPCHLRFNPI